MFFIHHTSEKFSGHSGLMFEENSVRGKSRDYRDVIVFAKLPFDNLLRLHGNMFSNSFALKSVFQKLRFRGGLVRTVRVTVEIKL